MKFKQIPYLTAAASWLILSYSIFFFVADNEKVVFWTSEDGIFETASAIFFLLSAILFFASFLKHKKETDLFRFRSIVFLLLSGAFLLGFLEEISWGQRIFDVPTPQFLQEANAQGEINLHNLNLFHQANSEGQRKFLSVERAFSLFWLGYCCLLPLLYNLHGQTRKFLDRIAFPVVPMLIGVFFALNYLWSKLIVLNLDTILHYPVVEIKEANFAFLFLVVSILFVRSSAIRSPRRVA